MDVATSTGVLADHGDAETLPRYESVSCTKCDPIYDTAARFCVASEHLVSTHGEHD